MNNRSKGDEKIEGTNQTSEKRNTRKKKEKKTAEMINSDYKRGERQITEVTRWKKRRKRQQRKIKEKAESEVDG